jgi:hypothetical protein
MSTIDERTTSSGEIRISWRQETPAKLVRAEFKQKNHIRGMDVTEWGILGMYNDSVCVSYIPPFNACITKIGMMEMDIRLRLNAPIDWVE